MKKISLLILIFTLLLVGCGSPAPEPAVEQPVVESSTSEEAGEALAEPEPAAEAVSEPVEEEPATAVEEAVAADEAYPVAEVVAAAEEVAAYPAVEPTAIVAYPVDGEAAESGTVKPASIPFSIDVEASRVDWVGFKPAGRSHNGFVNISEGTVELVNDVLNRASFTLDMTSITNLDMTGGMKDQLEGHLKSDDFFGVENFPTATLTIKSAEPDGTGVYNVVADLTMKDITNEITFPALASVTNDQFDAKADITIDRSLWDIRFGSGSFFDNLGDDLISNDIQLTVQITAFGP